MSAHAMALALTCIGQNGLWRCTRECEMKVREHGVQVDESHVVDLPSPSKV